MPNSISSAAVERLFTQFLKPQRGIIGSSFGLLADAGVHHLGDKKGVIACFNGIHHPTLHERGGILQNGCAGRARSERLSGNRLPFAFSGFEEGECYIELAFTQYVERKDP